MDISWFRLPDGEQAAAFVCDIEPKRAILVFAGRALNGTLRSSPNVAN
jgi:hypothetical protein